MMPDTATIQTIPIGYGIAVFIMGIVLTTALGLLGYFIRDLKKDMDKKDQNHDRAIEKLYNGFGDFRVHCSETFESKEDFSRSMVRMEAKIDDQGRIMRGVARDLNKVIGEIGAPHVAS